MTEERDQGPHYSPQLDPENPESGPKVKQRFLWFLILTGVVCILIGSILLANGATNAGLVAIGIGVIFLTPILIWFPWA